MVKDREEFAKCEKETGKEKRDKWSSLLCAACRHRADRKAYFFVKHFFVSKLIISPPVTER